MKGNKSALAVFGSFLFVVVGVYLDVVAFIFSILLLLRQLVLDQPAYFKENNVDVDIVFGTGLHKLNTVFLGKFLSLLKGNLPIFFPTVRLVSDDDFTYALWL